MRPRIAFLSMWFAVCLLVSCLPFAQAGSGPVNISLRVTRGVLLANGRDKTLIIAEVRDPNGRQAGNGIDVQFQTTLGTLSTTHAQSFGGTAQAELTGNVAGIAHINALVAGAVSNTAEVEFTDDPDALAEGSNYIQVSGSSYLAYSATDRVIEATGKNGGAKVTFRNLEIHADNLQLRCDDNIVRAKDNVTIRRGHTVVHVNRLYYSLNASLGYAIAEKDGRLQTVLLTGGGLVMEPVPNPIPNTYMKMQELQVKLVITARDITYFPGSRLQFRRPRFYQDQVQMLAMNYYEMALNSTELFSDQFVSVGTNGLGLELPYYYNLTPKQTGIVYLWHQQQLGRSYFAQSQGWGVDVVQQYRSQGGQNAQGEYGFTGLTRSDWGFRWTHNQEFNSRTQGAFYLDFPQHNSVTASSNVTQTLGKLRWGTNLYAGQTFVSPAATSLRNDTYIETIPHNLAGSPNMLYTLGTNFSRTDNHTSDPLYGSQSETTGGATFRAYSRPIAVDKRTSFTNSFSVGQTWSDRGKGGIATLATLALDHTVPGGGTMRFSYDFVNEPANLYTSSGRHRLGLRYDMAGKKFFASLFGSAYADNADASFLADMSYRLNTHWRLLLSATLQQFDGENYRDLAFTVGRRIGAREVQLTYSTLYKRISLDLTATRF